MYKPVAIASLLASVAYGQQIGSNTAESHPKLTTSQCTASGCTAQAGSVVLDSNWRWTHTTSGYTNCYTGNSWDASLCPDGATCASNCAVDGADYSGTYGITTSGDALTLKFVTGKNVGSRVYLMDTADSKYQMFNLKNQEFTFDVDVSNMPCGLNGALYFVSMDADGGLSKYSTNKAGAKYGTGYCDSQCPQDIKWINGQANVEGWVGSSGDPNSGAGSYGSCCHEMDIWEANKISTAYTPHPCSIDGQSRCEGTECGVGDARYDGVCDKDGCDFNSYRLGNESFYGPGQLVNTNSKFTVVTQFVTADGTNTGALSEIRRKYVQNGVVIDNSVVDVAGVDPVNSISTDFCTQQKTAFGDTNSFSTKGGLQRMSAAWDAGMVLVMSIWDDHAAEMEWLDAPYPASADPAKPGVSRGTCTSGSGAPETVEKESPNSSVTFSNIKYGPIDSTY